MSSADSTIDDTLNYITGDVNMPPAVSIDPPTINDPEDAPEIGSYTVTEGGSRVYVLDESERFDGYRFIIGRR